MKIGRILALSVAMVAIAALASTSALAVCPNSSTFGQITYACGGGTLFCYVVSPGESTPESMQASFWTIGSGDPAIGVGNDNGSYGDDNWMRPYAGSFYMSGDWASGVGIDGCVDTAPASQQMAAVFSDTDAAGNAYWAVAAVETAGAAAAVPYDFTFESTGGTPRDINLVAMPNVSISDSRRNATDDTQVDLDIVCPDLTGGYYTGSGAVSADAAIQGCAVFQQVLANGAMPQSRAAADWTNIGSVANGTTGTVTLDCSSNATGDAYVAIGIAGDSGFTSAYVGADSALIACDPNLANPGGNRKFKLIDREPKKGGNGVSERPSREGRSR